MGKSISLWMKPQATVKACSDEVVTGYSVALSAVAVTPTPHPTLGEIWVQSPW